MLSTWNPSFTSSRLGGVSPRDSRKNDWLPQAATYSVLPSSDISRPLAPDDSLPGTFCQPVAVCHSHSSPFIAPFCSSAKPAGLPRGRKFVAMNPPSGSPLTEFKPIGSGATAHPIQVSAGVVGRASSSNTSTDSRPPCTTTKRRWTLLAPASRYSPCVWNLALVPASGAPGHVL